MFPCACKIFVFLTIEMTVDFEDGFLEMLLRNWIIGPIFYSFQLFLQGKWSEIQ